MQSFSPGGVVRADPVRMGSFCADTGIPLGSWVVNPFDSGTSGPAQFGSAFVQRHTFRHGKALLNAFVRVDVAGREHLPASGPFLLAANHVSHFDPPLLTLAADRWIDWVAMVELYRHGLFAGYLRALPAIPCITP